MIPSVTVPQLPGDPGPRARRRPGPVLGIDLAGSSARATGVAYLAGPSGVRARVVRTDEEVLAHVERSHPALVLVDAPLSLPRGRASLDDRSGPHLRECDRELRRLGIRFFPLTLGPMRLLTERGLRLASEIERRGVRCLEGYPGGSQDLLGIPRNQHGLVALQRGLRLLGLRGDLLRRRLSHDELDAVTLSWVARAYLLGRARTIGDPDEGVMVLPHGVARGSRGSRPRDARARPK